MPRKKVDLTPIEDKAAQQVTLSKRRRGLFKKADELAIMTGAQVGVIVFSAANKLTHYGHPSLEEVIANWNAHADNTEPLENPPAELDVEQEYEQLEKKVAAEEWIIRQMENKDYGNLSLQELHQLEEFLRHSLKLHNTKERELNKQLTAELQRRHESLKVPSLEEMNQLNQEAVEKQNMHHETSESGVQRMPSDPLSLTLACNWNTSDSHERQC